MGQAWKKRLVSLMSILVWSGGYAAETEYNLKY